MPLCRIGVQPFLERHGLQACMVAPTKIIAGLGQALSIDVLIVPGATGALLERSWLGGDGQGLNAHAVIRCR